MTYKTRQEVLRAAADWIDVCEKAGVEPICKVDGHIDLIEVLFFKARPHLYEFPLALLEGKEVWVGSELYDMLGHKFVVTREHYNFKFAVCSWNPPEPETVLVKLPFAIATWYAAQAYVIGSKPDEVSEACKKALEELK